MTACITNGEPKVSSCHAMQERLAALERERKRRVSEIASLADRLAASAAPASPAHAPPPLRDTRSSGGLSLAAEDSIADTTASPRPDAASPRLDSAAVQRTQSPSGHRSAGGAVSSQAADEQNGAGAQSDGVGHTARSPRDRVAVLQVQVHSLRQLVGQGEERATRAEVRVRTAARMASSRAVQCCCSHSATYAMFLVAASHLCLLCARKRSISFRRSAALMCSKCVMPRKAGASGWRARWRR
jgi:hypothetical protein